MARVTLYRASFCLLLTKPPPSPTPSPTFNYVTHAVCISFRIFASFICKTLGAPLPPPQKRLKSLGTCKYLHVGAWSVYVKYVIKGLVLYCLLTYTVPAVPFIFTILQNTKHIRINVNLKFTAWVQTTVLFGSLILARTWGVSWLSSCIYTILCSSECLHPHPHPTPTPPPN